MFLLDTNAVSELMKPRPDAGFMDWYASTQGPALFYSVLTIAELARGARRLDPGPKRRSIENFIFSLLLERDDQVPAVGIAEAEAWTEVVERHKHHRVTVNAIDELIAATAISRDLTVITRNVRDFERSGCRLLSPWSG